MGEGGVRAYRPRYAQGHRGHARREQEHLRHSAEDRGRPYEHVEGAERNRRCESISTHKVTDKKRLRLLPCLQSERPLRQRMPHQISQGLHDGLHRDLHRLREIRMREALAGSPCIQQLPRPHSPKRYRYSANAAEMLSQAHVRESHEGLFATGDELSRRWATSSMRASLWGSLHTAP